MLRSNTNAQPDGRYYSLTIQQAIQRIAKNTIVLPLVQRNFVWDTDRVTKLFDSILMGYPISSMLFWDVASANAEQVRMYSFIKDFTRFQGTLPTDYLGRHTNEIIIAEKLRDAAEDGQLLAVLDGQQRLTSLYMGLCGSHATKDANGWNEKLYNFPPRQLYLRLSGPEDDAQGLDAGRYKYKLAWRRQDITHVWERATVDTPPFRWYPSRGEVWVRVGCVMQADQQQPQQWAAACVAELRQQIEVRRMAGDQNHYLPASDELVKIQDTFERLHRAVYHDQHISYFLLGQENTLGQAVETFVRINRGGLELDYTDMLFALLGANWQRDVRKAVNELENRLQQLDQRFDKRFILKSALIMVADRNREFNLNQFTPAYIQQMEIDWDIIGQALQITIQFITPPKEKTTTLLGGFHFFSATTLTHVVAYYHYKALKNNYHYDQRDEIRIRQWLIRAQLMWWYKQANTETKLRHLIQVVAEYFGEDDRTDFSFPFEKLQDAGLLDGGPNLRLQSTSQAISYKADIAVSELLKKYIGEPGTKFLLALLQSDVIHHAAYDVDHCYPNSNAYQATEQERLAYPGHDDYNNIMQQLPNLQLLTDSENRSKSYTPLYEWLKNLSEREAFMATHLIPAEPQINHEFGASVYLFRRESFQVFFARRKELMTDALQRLLQDPA